MKSHQYRIYQEKNTSTIWYLQLWSLLFGEAQGIHDALGQVPDVVYKNNPGKTSVLPEVGSTGIMGFISKISPYLFFLSPIAMWEDTKIFYQEKNKSFEKTLDYTVTQVKRVAALAATIVAMSGAAYLAPYLLAGLLGLGAIYAVFNIGKHLYRAYHAHKEGDKNKRNQHLWGSVKQLFNLVIETIGFVLNLDFGFNISSKLSSALKLANAGNFLGALTLTKSAGALFQATKSLLYSVGALIMISSVPNTMKKAIAYNQDTWHAIQHPTQALKNIAESYKKKCDALWAVFQTPIHFMIKTRYLPPVTLVIATGLACMAVGALALETASLVLNAAARTLSLLISPLHYFAKEVKKLVVSGKRDDKATNKLFTSDVTIQIALAKQEQMKKAERQQALQVEHAELQMIVEKELAHLKQQQSNKPADTHIQTTLEFVTEMQNKLGTTVIETAHTDAAAETKYAAEAINPKHYDLTKTVDEIEQTALSKNPRLHYSFWGSRNFKDEESNIEKISRLMKAFDTKVRQERNASQVPATRMAAGAA